MTSSELLKELRELLAVARLEAPVPEGYDVGCKRAHALGWIESALEHLVRDLDRDGVQ